MAVIMRLAMAALLLSSGAIVAAAPVKPVTAARKAAVTWAETFAATPDGGFRRGNPAARVKLIEYGSLTCPHCRVFHGEAMRKLLGTYVASGNVSYEYRSFVLNGPDYAASLVARCSGDAKRFFAALDSFYPDQPQWTAPFIGISEADGKQIAAQPPEKQIAALARVGKLDAYAAKLGMERTRFDACVGDKAAADRLVEIRKVAVDTYKVTGTPGFIINGVYQKDVSDWRSLEPNLQAALKP